MLVYDFPGADAMSAQLKGVVSGRQAKAFRAHVVRSLSSMTLDVGEVFTALRTARNNFVERHLTLKEWIDARMNEIVEAITPNDDEFRTQLLRSWEDANS